MKVCVIVPTRDRPADLARAVRAIAAQQHADLQIVIVDDGSSATTRDAVRALVASMSAASACSVTLVEHGAVGGHGSGPAGARNAGLQAAQVTQTAQTAQATLVAFCDDDDEWTDPAHLTRAVAAFTQDDTLDLYIGNQLGVATAADGQRVLIADWLPALTRTLGPDALQRPVPVTVDQLCKAGGFAHLNTVVLRRTLVDASGPFWPAVRYEEDRDFYFRALGHCRRAVACLAPMARHHVPNPALAASASTRQSLHDKLLVSGLVSRHIALTARHPAVRRLALAAEGDTLRHLTGLLLQDGRPAAAASTARLALAQRFSWKWAGYALWLRVQLLWRSEPAAATAPTRGTT